MLSLKVSHCTALTSGKFHAHANIDLMMMLCTILQRLQTMLVSSCRGLTGKFEQLTPGPESKLNARTRVHEYGGGESIIGDGVLYFSNFE